MSEPVVIPSSIDANKKKKIITKPSQFNEIMQGNINKKSLEKENSLEENDDLLKDIELEEIPESEYMPEVDINELQDIEEPVGEENEKQL